MVFVIAEKCAEAEALKHLSQAVGDDFGARVLFAGERLAVVAMRM